MHYNRPLLGPTQICIGGLIISQLQLLVRTVYHSDVIDKTNKGRGSFVTKHTRGVTVPIQPIANRSTQLILCCHPEQ